jgi:hypothetical protein
MNSEAAQEAKPGGVGRVRTSAAKREAMLDEFERSGLSAARFAAMAGVKNQTFGQWVRRRRRGLSPGVVVRGRRSVDPQFIEAVSGGPGNGGFFLELPGGAKAWISTPSQVPLAAALLMSLEGGGRPC